MLIIQRLYLKAFLKVLAVLVIGISSVFSIISIIDRVDDFMPHNPSPVSLFQYALFSIPKYVHYLLPMAVLLSSLFTFSQAMRTKEILVIKASAGRIKTIFMPFVITGILLTIFSFVLGEFIVPETSKRMHSIKNRIIKKQEGFKFKEGTFYMRGRDGSVVRISLYLPDRNIMKGVSIFKFDEYGLKDRIDAETAEWADDKWKLRNVRHYDVSTGMISRLKDMHYYGIESPNIFREEVWKAEEMSILELVRYQKRLKESGFKNIRLIVDISSRLSYPLVNIFMLLLGMSLSMEAGFLYSLSSHSTLRMGSGIIAAGLGLLISLIYWFGYSLFLSLGYAGTIPPIVAPWIVPVIFAGISVYSYSQIPE